MAMHYPRRLAGVLAALVVVTMLATPSAAQACDLIAHWDQWHDNCLTDWQHHRVSDLTTGVQVVLKYDGRPGWVSATDGVYGYSNGSGSTPRAVRYFQTSQGIADDGKTGPVTWDRLDNTFYFSSGIYSGGSSWFYYTIDVAKTQVRMKTNFSTGQDYVKKKNGVWVRVDAWRS